MLLLNFQPWICEPDAPEVVELFLKRGRKRQFDQDEVFEIGRDSSDVYLIKTGMIVLHIEDGQWFANPRAYSVYLPGRVLGAVRSITTRASRLHARAVRRVEALSMPCSEFRAHVAANDRLHLAAAYDIISKQGTQNEGLLANLLLTPPQRLALLLQSIFAAFKMEIRTGWNRVPVDLNTEEYGSIVHTTRITVSRVFGEWKRDGLFKRTGRQIEINGTLFERPLSDTISEPA
jgi:CRP-like cAMP-binding protein